MAGSNYFQVWNGWFETVSSLEWLVRHVFKFGTAGSKDWRVFERLVLNIVKFGTGGSKHCQIWDGRF